MNQSLKSWSIHHGIDHYSEKKKEAKNNIRGQIWGQANFWGQAKIWVEAKIEAKIEARPTLGPGQANEARPGFIVCRWGLPECSDCGRAKRSRLFYFHCLLMILFHTKFYLTRNQIECFTCHSQQIQDAMFVMLKLCSSNLVSEWIYNWKYGCTICPVPVAHNISKFNFVHRWIHQEKALVYYSPIVLFHIWNLI